MIGSRRMRHVTPSNCLRPSRGDTNTIMPSLFPAEIHKMHVAVDRRGPLLTPDCLVAGLKNAEESDIRTATDRSGLPCCWIAPEMEQYSRG
jgi:hypothetical protein